MCEVDIYFLLRRRYVPNATIASPWEKVGEPSSMSEAHEMAMRVPDPQYGDVITYISIDWISDIDANAHDLWVVDKDLKTRKFTMRWKSKASFVKEFDGSQKAVVTIQKLLRISPRLATAAILACCDIDWIDQTPFAKNILWAVKSWAHGELDDEDFRDYHPFDIPFPIGAREHALVMILGIAKRPDDVYSNTISRVIHEIGRRPCPRPDFFLENIVRTTVPLHLILLECAL